MRRHALVVLLVLAMVVSLGGLAAAAPPQQGSSPSHDYVTLTFTDPPAATYEGGIPSLAATKPERGQKLDPNSPAVRAYVGHLRGVHQDFRDYLASKAPRAEVTNEWFLVANGVAVKLNGHRIQTLQQGPGVARARFSSLFEPTMNVSTALIGADDLWGDDDGRKDAGAGIKVGVIDSGIDDTHDFFACKGGEIVHKVYASGAAFDPSNTLVFDHGTHVAGTIGGCVIGLTDGPITGDISGVAPAAELWDYNVFPGFGAGFVAFGGSAFAHDIIDALEDAVVDDMDIVNMSLGGGCEGPDDTLSEAVNAFVDTGRVAAVAAGNSGPGDSTIGCPGAAANALTAGASTNPHFAGISVEFGSDTFGAALGDFENFDPALTADYTETEPADGCTSISTDLTGKIALIDRGTCTFTTKVRNAESAGAIGVLIVNNVAGDPVGMAHDGTEPFPTIPAAMVSKDDGEAMKPSGTVTVDGTEVTEFVTDNADIIAGFSSRGPTAFTYLIKPDATAPGVNVYSSVFDNEFAFFQGTSMATPHFAGAAALLLALHPEWDHLDVKSALVNTAERVVTDHVTGTEDPGVLTRGSGRIFLPGAEGTPLTFDPVSASFGLWQGNKPVQGGLDIAVKAVGDCESPGVIVVGDTDASGKPIVTAEFSGSTLTLTLDAGRSNRTPSGDYEGDVEVTCADTTLTVPWWVRIERSPGTGATTP